MITTKRIDAEHSDFLELVRSLDIEMQLRDGPDHAFYAQFHGVNAIQHAVIAYDGEQAVGCGAIKAYDDETIEIKRMFVTAPQRGKGIGALLLRDLESWANEMGYKKCLLETGIRHTESIELYSKNQYEIIPNFGEYANAKSSVCFTKNL